MFRVAAEVYRELGPEYRDAVAESFVEKINREIEARVGARLAAVPRAPGPDAGSSPYRHRLPVTGLAAGAVVTGIPPALVLVVLQGSVAARADWVQWVFGALLVSVAVSGVAALARRAQVRAAGRIRLRIAPALRPGWCPEDIGVRTLSVFVRDFRHPGLRAHGRIADRADSEDHC